VDGYFPRGVVSSIYAPRDAGKTTVAIHFLAELSRGRLFGAEHSRIRSLFNSQEDSLETVIKPRLEAHDADFGTSGRKDDPWIPSVSRPAGGAFASE
jgi:KaiC/GvpD/RAD55 family RecA-like ATPase